MSAWRVWADLAVVILAALLVTFFVLAVVNGEWGVAWIDLSCIVVLALLWSVWAAPPPSSSP